MFDIFMSGPGVAYDELGNPVVINNNEVDDFHRNQKALFFQGVPESTKTLLEEGHIEDVKAVGNQVSITFKKGTHVQCKLL